MRSEILNRCSEQLRLLGYSFEFFPDLFFPHIPNGIYQQRQFRDALLNALAVEFDAGQADLFGRDRIDGLTSLGVERFVAASSARGKQDDGKNQEVEASHRKW